MNSNYNPILPSFRTGQYNSPESGFPCMMSVQGPSVGRMIEFLRNTVSKERRLLFVDDRVLMVCINWIRDHVHMMKAFKHWEHDILSFYQFILDNQSEEGWYYELIKQIDDIHWSYVHPEFMRKYPEDNVAATRLELEADIEYLMVEGAMQIYRVTGDDAWIQAALPKLEKGIDYMTSHPDRWEPTLGLCKRPFTIDTWDFTYGKPGSNRKIEPDTPMSVMHGDNSGVYDAMMSLAWLRRRFGDEQKAAEWEKRAADLKANMYKHLWNGKFFMHQLHLGHAGADDQEANRLSLSNAYDLNRGVTDLEQSVAILNEYRSRRETTDAFAEWFSIDPPYPKFGDHPCGKYVNGGITPFTAGELAKAAFRSGMEEYGWDILQRLMAMLERDHTIFFIYDREAGERDLGGGPSGWGAAAILSAIEEGLAGISDLDVQFRKMAFAPRWTVTEHMESRFITGYELTKEKVDMYMRRDDEHLWYRLSAPSQEVQCHILLPKGKQCAKVTVNGTAVDFVENKVLDSVYADFTLTGADNGRDAFGWAKANVWEINLEYI